jgi:aspartyl-tRNA(Asn)/glutamyl-tRNA(Gln) amidotransferase subunit C
MTQISHDDVQHLARLSNLQLADGEEAALRGDIETILDYVQQLSELDTDGVEPTYQVTDRENVWRNDEVDNYGINTDDLLALAPEAINQQIKVPKVL